MIYYYVEKIGVYPHGVFGIFDDLDQAISRANRAQSEDSDDYHDWVVRVCDVDNTVCDYKDTHPNHDKILYSTPRDLTNV